MLCWLLSSTEREEMNTTTIVTDKRQLQKRERGDVYLKWSLRRLSMRARPRQKKRISKKEMKADG